MYFSLSSWLCQRKTFLFINFLILSISDFSLFLCKNCNPPEKFHPSLSQQIPSKNFDLEKSPLFGHLLRVPTTEERGNLASLI